MGQWSSRFLINDSERHKKNDRRKQSMFVISNILRQKI